MDLTFHTNYTFGFPESNSDILLNLTHWQYWWWFWFTYLLTIYYFIFLKLLKQRTLKFYPKMVTSYRSHGKWGDFIVCFLPISWCINILSNSNFILRMIEWQTESNLFTVRIRGKQWYWIYKIEIKTILNITQIPKNMGYNYWALFNTTNLKYCEDYINILQLKNANDWLQNYLDTTQLKPMTTMTKNRYFNVPTSYESTTLATGFEASVFGDAYTNTQKTIISNLTHHTNDIIRYFRHNYYSTFQPLKVDLLANNIFAKFNTANNNVTHRYLPENMYLVIKQKKYLPSKKLSYFNKKSLHLTNCSVLETIDVDKNNTRLIYNTQRTKPQTMSHVHYRRLLRTRRILVLPTNINITLITNSFDVVHSWYIPGLGIKLDCIPGRSTHHTINIDHAGFYYGQCAEICGRFHHHMPIRVCALPFEQFLIWWYQYGLPYFNAGKKARKLSIQSGINQYSW